MPSTGTILSCSLISFALLAVATLQPAQELPIAPPSERTIASPSRHYRLTLRGPEVILQTSSGKIVWQKILPYKQGPRDAMVTNDGHTILADEWSNVASSHAIVLLDREGGAIAHISTDEIFRTLGVERKVMVALATHGIWITDGPTLAPDGKAVIFHSGGRILTLHLADGRLTVSD